MFPRVTIRDALRWLAAIAMVAVGVDHFVNPAPFAGIVPAVLAMAKDPAAAKAKAAQGLAVVKKRFAETMAMVGKSVG